MITDLSTLLHYRSCRSIRAVDHCWGHTSHSLTRISTYTFGFQHIDHSFGKPCSLRFIRGGFFFSDRIALLLPDLPYAYFLKTFVFTLLRLFGTLFLPFYLHVAFPKLLLRHPLPLCLACVLTALRTALPFYALLTLALKSLQLFKHCSCLIYRAISQCICIDMPRKAYKRTVAAEPIPSTLTDCQLSITAEHPHFEGLGSTRPSMAAYRHLRGVLCRMS